MSAQTEVAQSVHADIYGVSREELERGQQEAREDNGGSICTICRRKGCTIGPMGRGCTIGPMGRG